MKRNPLLTISRLLLRPPLPGHPPGDVEVEPGGSVEPAIISVFRYDAQQFHFYDHVTAEALATLRHDQGVVWINLDGIRDVRTVRCIAEMFDLHPLMLEDILSTSQTPKCESYGQHLYAVVQMMRNAPDSYEVIVEQVNFVMAGNVLLTFQDIPGDVFDGIRHRIRTGRQRLRASGADYLFYSLLDAVVDASFSVFDRFSEQLGDFEEKLMEEPTPEDQKAIHEAKKRALLLRRAALPLVDMVATLQRDENRFFTPETQLFLRDLSDHARLLRDGAENIRELSGGLQELYLAGLSNKMNIVMKVLAVISTIFVPVTFVAGVYGMNFDHMPELHSPWAYPAVLCVMATMILSMLGFLRWKRWL